LLAQKSKTKEVKKKQLKTKKWETKAVHRNLPFGCIFYRCLYCIIGEKLLLFLAKNEVPGLGFSFHLLVVSMLTEAVDQR